MAQMERLYWIDAEIRARRFPNPERCCQKFDITPRTAWADAKFLRERLNAPLLWDRERGGWMYSDPTFVLPQLLLTDREVAALRRSLLAAREFGGARDTEPLRLLAKRLGEHLPGLPESRGESVGGGIHLSETALVRPELFEDCRRAVERRQKLYLRYHGAHRDEETERTIRPYHLRNWRGEWYLIAWCELRQDMRDFFLGRVRDWRCFDEDAAFRIHSGFDLDAYLSRGFEVRHGGELVTVRVRFTPYQARWVRERRYHPSQTIQDLPDGDLILTLLVAGIEEIRRWVLSYGAEAEVLEPPSLRAAMAAETKKLSEKYGC